MQYEFATPGCQSYLQIVHQLSVILSIGCFSYVRIYFLIVVGIAGGILTAHIHPILTCKFFMTLKCSSGEECLLGLHLNVYHFRAIFSQ